MNNIEYVKSLADGFLNPSEENIEKCVRLSYLTRFLIYELKKKNIDTVVLKGVSLAWSLSTFNAISMPLSLKS